MPLPGNPTPPAPDPDATVAEWGPASSGAGADKTDRYTLLTVLGTGGMGEVWRARDHHLRRTVAMKRLHAHRNLQDAAVARFREEAELVAQLNHPGVVPVYELGQDRDGRWYFTMPEIEGQTLKAALQAHHQRPGERGLRGLIDPFLRVCEAVAYAHDRGLVHRDLKPDNIMLGRFGRVLVLDWGIARVIGSSSPLESSRQEAGLFTMAGAISGTPAYMAPEQAWGEPDLGPAVDVYALGATLYELLSGRPPYVGERALQVLEAVRRGPPPPLPEGSAPAELRELCAAAMARNPAQRPAEASLLVRAVVAFLDGARRQERALALVAEADTLAGRQTEPGARAARLRAEATARLAAVPRHAPVAEKLPAWRLFAEAEEARRESQAHHAEWLRLLHTALTEDPQCSAARDRITDHHAAAHAAAEAAGHTAAAEVALMQLRLHDRGRHAAYLSGEGSLSLLTEPSGAEVEALRFVEVDRRLVAQPFAHLGPTPLVERPLPMGSYLLRIRHPDRPLVELPVAIRRQERWERRPPGAAAPLPLRLPTEAPAGLCFVPGGWFEAGDLGAPRPAPRQRLWVDDLWMDQRTVTQAQFLAFVNDLLDQGREEEALAVIEAPPPGQPVLGGGRGAALLYDRDANGHFCLAAADEQGVTWQLDWPALRVTAGAAEAYAAWRSAREGRPWRQPGQYEWEKASRGVDGRIYPWGDHFEPTWCNCRFSRPGPPTVASADEHPLDRGPYGLLGMAGNVSEWCHDGPTAAPSAELPEAALRVQPQAAAGPLRWVRGGHAGVYETNCRLGWRQAAPADCPQDILGFRLVSPLT
jgi:serine/threonine-protein kinase